MTTFEVQLGRRSYRIYIGRNVLAQLSRHIRGDAVFVVSNETVAPLYLQAVLAHCEQHRSHQLILPDGETCKTLETVSLVYDALLKHHCDRDTTLVALGGGVIGDITGFAAATYQRGINFIQIPTTLLAQVDSSIGGKTGVNHELGKNMIGSFYQPNCVIADLATLDTLDDRQFSAGVAEIIKYGLIRDAGFFGWLENNIGKLMARVPEALTHAVCRSCENKARIVAEDELEQTGKRALLNYGHTFGHAIETHTNYASWLHGEAVACGMRMAGSPGFMAAAAGLTAGWTIRLPHPARGTCGTRGLPWALRACPRVGRR